MSYARMHAPSRMAHGNVAGDATASMPTPINNINPPTNRAINSEPRPEGIGRSGLSAASTRASQTSLRIMPARYDIRTPTTTSTSGPSGIAVPNGSAYHPTAAPANTCETTVGALEMRSMDNHACAGPESLTRLPHGKHHPCPPFAQHTK